MSKALKLREKFNTGYNRLTPFRINKALKLNDCPGTEFQI